MDPALKHRLIGAAVLSALAIIFLPMLIVGRDRNDTAASVPLSVPSAPGGNFETKELPLVAPAPGVPNGGVVGMDAAHPPASTPASGAAPVSGAVDGSPLASGAGPAHSAPPASASASPMSSATASPANSKTPAATNPVGSPAASPVASVKAAPPLVPPVATVASPISAVAPNAAAPKAVAPSVPSGPIPAASAGGHYVVSLGTYSSPANAQSLVASLKGAQLPAYAESVTVGGKQATRVRIGPFGQRGDAEAARLKAQQVRKDMPASVTALDAATPAADAAPANKPASATTKPAATAAASNPSAAVAASGKTTAPATASIASSATADKPVAVSPAASGRGYAVQVSAYRTEGEALTLRNKLRAAGFTAFSERIQADSGTMYRVRVGPEADRDAADKLRAELSAKMSLNGMVVGYP
jgi:DedD protein